MSNVQSAQGATTSVTSAAAFDRADLESSLATVIGALKGGTGAKALEKGNVNEEQLYAAFVYSELKKTNPALADKMLKDLPSNFKMLKENKEPKPIYGAIEKFFEQIKKSDKLKGSQIKNIREQSLGMAQVDHRQDRIGSRKLQFKDVGTVDPKTTYMDKLVSKLEDNKGATKKEVESIKEGFEIAKERGKVYAPEKNKPRIVKYEGKITEETSVTAPKNDKKEVPTEQDVITTEKNDGSKHRFESDELGYKPISEKDGNALIQLPIDIARKVKFVSIYDAEGNEIAKVEPVYVEQDGRRYARFDKPGSTFGDMFVVKLTFIDGFEHKEKIDKADSIYARKL